MPHSKDIQDLQVPTDLQTTVDLIALSIIKAFFFVCIPLTTLSLIRVFTLGFLPVMGLHIFLLLVLSTCFFFRKKIPTLYLSITIVIIFFLLALGGFYTYQLSIYLAAGTVLSLTFSALLLSSRAAYFALALESLILIAIVIPYSKNPLTQALFEVVVYCVFSCFVIFAIQRVKNSFLNLISGLKEKELNIQDVNQKLVSANRSKSKFLALMSHEIRTPINSILLASEQFRETSLDEDQRELLNVINSSNDNVQLLINNILDYTKAEASKVNLESKPFNLKNLLNTIIQTTSLEAKRKGLVIELSYDHPVKEFLGDKLRVSQVFLNLLSNSIKFTEKGSIKISVSKDLQTSLLTVSVKDTGIGIKPERINDIFQEFVQEDNSTTRLFGGTGLGLAIVKQLVELMNGSIEVKSQKKLGSEFIIRLYLEEPLDPTEFQNQKLRPRNYQNIRVLIFEDNEINSKLMKKRLEKMGFETVCCASNGQEGLNLMKESQFDIIFMDIQMPILGGIETTKIIRSQAIGSNTLDITIIGLSANSFEEDIEEASRAGMDDYLSKPATKEALQEVLEQYCTSASDKFANS